DMFFYFLESRLVNQRPHLHIFLHSIAGFQPGYGRYEFFGKGIENGVLNQKAVGSYTSLPGISEFRNNGSLNGLIEVGIVEYQERGVAAQFERDLLNGSCSLFHQDTPH